MLTRCMTCDKLSRTEFIDVDRDLTIGVCRRCAASIRAYEGIRQDEKARRREKRAGRGTTVSNYNRTKTRKI